MQLLSERFAHDEVGILIWSPVFCDELGTVSAFEGKGPTAGDEGWYRTVVPANMPATEITDVHKNDLIFMGILRCC